MKLVHWPWRASCRFWYTHEKLHVRPPGFRFSTVQNVTTRPSTAIVDASLPDVQVWSSIQLWGRSRGAYFPVYGRPIGQAIIFYSCGFFLSSFFFSSPIFVAHGCLPHFHTWCGLSANLECRSEICCTRLAENTGRKNCAKSRHLRTIAQLCRATSSQRMHISLSTIGKIS